MTTAYTSLLGLALPVTGELSGTWGDTVNNSITSLLDTSVAGTTNVSTDTDVTLTTTTGAANQARQAILLFSGARTALRTVTAPAQSKIYTVINATTGGFSVKLVGAGPTTGVTIANGARTVVAWNGSDFVELSSPNSIILPGGTANGVLYLNGSKVVTSGSALTFNGTVLYTNGKIGVGETNPTALVEARNTSIARMDADSSAVYFGSGNNYPVSFKVNDSEQMRLTSTGLGIGTSSPSEKLHVNSGAGNVPALFESTDPIAVIQFKDNNSTGLVGVGAQTNSLIFYSNNAVNMRLDENGNLGLGVTPSAWETNWKGFEFKAAGNALFSGGNSDVRLTSGAYYNAGWKYGVTGSAVSYYFLGAGAHQWFNAASGTAGNAITFTQAMTLDASGRLGIGTTSPQTRLHVDQGADGNGITIAYAGRGASRCEWQVAGVNNEGCLFAHNNGTNKFTMLGMNRDALEFYTNNTERARIDSSGNFGLGVTPSAWFTGGGYKVMQIGPAMAFDSGTDYRARIAANGFVNSAGDWKYLNTGFASNYSQVSGQHQFYTAASGTAGNTITFTQAMTLDASGNLLLGTTTAIGKATIYKAGTGYSDSLVLSNDAAYGANQGIAWGSSTNISGRIKGVDDGAYGTNLTFETRTGGPSTTTTERARIDSSGTFLFGRTGADVGTNGFRIDPSGSTYASIATGNETSYVYSTSASAYRFYVNAAGTVFATNTTISAISDIRYKENVRDLDAGLAKVMALKPRLYDWKEGKGADIKNARGFIAQEFETVFPDLIDEWKDPAPEGEEPYKSVRQDLIPVLVKAIQEQQAIIESLKSRLDAANL